MNARVLWAGLVAGVVSSALLSVVKITSKRNTVALSSRAQATVVPAKEAIVNSEAVASASSAGQEKLAAPDFSPPSASADFQSRLTEILQVEDLVAQQRQLTELLERWVATDPEEALREAPEIVPAEMRDMVLREVIQAWAVRDPQSAADWALNVSDPVEQSRVMDQVFGKIAESNPERAAQLLQGHLDIVRPALIENVVQQWAASNIRSAYEWADAQPDGELREELLKRVAFVWSQTDPMQAAQFVVEQIPPGAVQVEAVVSVIHQWALKDLAAAGAWAQRFPQGELRNRVLAEVSGVAEMAMSNSPR